MTKADIVSEIAKKTGVEKTQIQVIVEAFMDEVKVISVKGSGTVIEMIKRFSSGAGNSLCDNAADVAWGKDA